MKPNIKWKGKSFSFYANIECEFFPCHTTETITVENFNCLFCFCPLYDKEKCGGKFIYLTNGYKDCSLCVFPHEKDNYGLIIEKL